MSKVIPVPSETLDLPLGLLNAVQTTISHSVQCTGIGLHSGLTTTVQIKPAPANAGRYFVRTDLPGKPVIPAQVASVGQTQLSTQLIQGDASIRTVEHLLAALVGLGIDNAQIEVDGPEIPLLDGSALPWVTALLQDGAAGETLNRSALSAPRQIPVITAPIWVQAGDAFVAALPSPVMRFTYGIEFAEPAIGKQWQSWIPSGTHFAEAIAPARTFGLAWQIDGLRSQGLIQGGSLENALVCDDSGWLNPPLRFENEPVRHKLLDLLGDLSLLGVIPQAHFLAFKASHQLHIQLATAILQAGVYSAPGMAMSG